MEVDEQLIFEVETRMGPYAGSNGAEIHSVRTLIGHYRACTGYKNAWEFYDGNEKLFKVTELALKKYRNGLNIKTVMKEWEKDK